RIRPGVAGSGAGRRGARTRPAEAGGRPRGRRARQRAWAQGPSGEADPMRVMVLGAGLAGTALARGLRARGHHVTQAGRDTRAGAGTVALALDALPDGAPLVRALRQLGVVVAPVGVLRP